MFKWYRHISVAARLRWLVMMFSGAVLFVALSLLWTIYQRQMADRQQAVRQAVEVAHSLVQWYGQQAQAGRMGNDAAQRQALAALDRLRYSEREYFWVNDMNHRMVHHPIKPALDGQDVGDIKDPRGVPLFRHFVQTVRDQGAGFVAYQWPKPGQEQPVDKISYVQGYAPWSWVIGSGLYVDDIRSDFLQQASQVMAGVLLCTLTLWALARQTSRRLVQGIDQAVTLAEAVATGDIRQASRQHRQDEAQDEIGRLSRAMR
ncbi:MAG TPA: cache domain-containing protein, partial [Aquabacterium sp.]|nr:cache domain-containing protein [Aquabacterium sp.]